MPPKFTTTELLEEWSTQKITIATKEREFVIFAEREVWMASLGENIGVEMNGKNSNFSRPVLIYRKYNKEQCFIFPLTSQYKNDKYHLDLSHIPFLMKSMVSLTQGRTIDSKRLIRKMGRLPNKDFENIKKTALGFLEPRSPFGNNAETMVPNKNDKVKKTFSE
ncbi:MAG: type II toxin-antitoxin system PemK/MazF family toxin [Candidatus Peregrinibacteria bacterium]